MQFPVSWLSAGEKRRLSLIRLIFCPAKIWLLDEPSSFLDDFNKMKVPVLLFLGDEDELCLDINLFLKRNIPASGLHIYPRTGHAINLEEPAFFNSQVHSFLTSVERGHWKQRDKRSDPSQSTTLGLTNE